jgi:hypothetical protein
MQSYQHFLHLLRSGQAITSYTIVSHKVLSRRMRRYIVSNLPAASYGLLADPTVWSNQADSLVYHLSFHHQIQAGAPPTQTSSKLPLSHELPPSDVTERARRQWG